MNLSRAIQHIRDNSKQYGPAAALHDLQYRAVNRMVPFEILKGMTAVVDDIDPRMFDAGAHQTRFCSPSEVEHAIAEPEIGDEMSDQFAHDALDKGDECYGIFDQDRLVSFGWYSTRPTPVSDDVLLHFDPAWVYMYKGYTLREYRGKRLHGIGMSLAARAYTERGSRGLISYVKSNNFPSLRSIARMGYRIFGEAYLARAFGRVFTWATPGCKPYGFGLAWLPERDERDERHTSAPRS